MILDSYRLLSDYGYDTYSLDVQFFLSKQDCKRFVEALNPTGGQIENTKIIIKLLSEMLSDKKKL